MTHTTLKSTRSTHHPKRRTRLGLALGLAALALLALAPSAVGFTTRPLVDSFGPDGTDATNFGTAKIGEDVSAIGFDQANRRLYVLDNNIDAIRAFDISVPGTYTPLGAPFPLSVTDPGYEGSGLSDLAVDSTDLASAGRIYYASRVSDTLYAFSATGAPLGSPFPISLGIDPCGVAVDSVGNIAVAGRVPGTTGTNLARIRRYTPAGAPLGAPSDLSAPLAATCRIAFAANDDLYIGSVASGSALYRLSAASDYDPAKATPVPGIDNPRAVVVDRAAGEVYGASFSIVAVFDSTTGSVLYRFPKPFADNIEIDEASDRVFVAGRFSPGSTTPQHVHVFGPPAEFPEASATIDPPANVTETSVDLSGTVTDESSIPTAWRFQVSSDDGATWINTNVAGTTAGGQTDLAVGGTATNLLQDTDYQVRLNTNKVPGGEDSPSVEQAFQTIAIPPATVAIDPPANITDSSADLSGTVTDNGPFPTNWRFEISDDGGGTWITAQDGESPIEGQTTGDEAGAAVSGTAAGLQPGGAYQIRLTTDKGHGAPDVSSPTEEFTTVSLPPLFENVGATRVTDTSAYLVGEVTPRAQLTTYHFEYTTDGFAGCGLPANPGCIKTADTDIVGSEPALAVAPVEGLEPGTEYSFKLVATNIAGASESAVLTLGTRAEPSPAPTDRAYEMVSPVDKNGGGALSGLNSATPAADGSAVAFCTTSLFGDPPGSMSGTCAEYVSRRTGDGWRTWSAYPPLCWDFDGGDGAPFISTSMSVSPDIERTLIGVPENPTCPLGYLDPAAPERGQNFYLADPGTDAYELIAPAPAFNATSQLSRQAEYAGGSDGWGHLLFTSTGNQTPDSPPPGDFAKIYDRHEGSLELISRDLSDEPLTTASQVAPAATITSQPVSDAVNGVSASGARVFFQNPTSGGCTTAGCELYMRESGAVTRWVSQQECSPACSDASGPDVLAFATPDGSRALFTSTGKLTNDDTSSAGKDLYLYTHSGNPAAQLNLSLLSKDEEPADGSGAGVLGVLGVSDDGESAVFAAAGQIVAGQPTAPGPKLYRWTRNGGSPQLDYLATLNDADADNWSPSNARYLRLLTPDGERLLLASAVRLDPLADHDTDRDVYRWDAQGGWLCVSCQVPGEPSAGDSDLTVIGGRTAARRHLMSEDGGRIFFRSSDPLSPGDVNTPVKDLYEWHEGTVELVSSGEDSIDIRLLGVGDDGRDIFFATAQQLVDADTDSVNDIYDARIDGGFPQPPPAEAPCEGSSCRGAGSDTPAPAAAGSAAFAGPGNPRAGGDGARRRCAKLAGLVRKQGRSAKRLRRAASRTRSPRRSRRLRARARRFAAAAKRNSNRAKRCRRAERRAAR